MVVVQIFQMQIIVEMSKFRYGGKGVIIKYTDAYNNNNKGDKHGNN